MKNIKKIKLLNFKRFPSFTVKFDEKLNLLIGDNEAGKSSVLTAIDLVLSGSRNKVESIGLENMITIDTIQHFLNSDKEYKDLPKLYIELYLNEQNNPDLNGRVNSENYLCDGLQLICEPNDDLSKEIKEILNQDEPNFPYEYYSIIFKTFSGEPYSGYRRFMNQLLIDNTQINNEYATREYVKTIYSSNVSYAEKNKHRNEYRKHKESFKNNVLADLNSRIDSYSFNIKTSTKSNLETDLTISENDIVIENKGKGKQCFIKTEFALNKNSSELHVILIEEPENHLSHVNMKKLIRRINETDSKQLFIATHSNLISARLDLRKAILLNSNKPDSISLNELSESTAKFFMKAPDHNILEYILSKKVLLVEGDAEYILMESFFINETNEKLEDSDVHIISVGGTSFKRYLDIAKLLNIKTAVIRDNDKDYQQNCLVNYEDYIDPNIKVFSDNNNDIYTFEIALYNVNTKLCDELFGPTRRTLSVEEYMLQNKAEVAFELLENKGKDLNTPLYIKEAIKWIKE